MKQVQAAKQRIRQSKVEYLTPSLFDKNSSSSSEQAKNIPTPEGHGILTTSSPNQLVCCAASVVINPDQTASGRGLELLAVQASTDRATRLAQIRRDSFERLGDAWRILAGQ